MAFVEKCDMVWGADGNPVLLSGDFDRRLQEEGRTSNRSSIATPPQRSSSSLSWRRKSTRSSLTDSLETISLTTTVKDEGEYREVVEGGHVGRRRKLVNRAGARIRRMARNTGEVGLKIVALPTFVLLDMVS